MLYLNIFNIYKNIISLDVLGKHEWESVLMCGKLTLTLHPSYLPEVLPSPPFPEGYKRGRRIFSHYVFSKFAKHSS